MSITRFAPSPTGYLHVGNVRTALTNWLYARSSGGEFILRIDDTDQARSEQKYMDAIEEDLKWLGLDWDSTFSQSDRFDKYEVAKNKLIADGRLYECFETKEELEFLKRKLLNRNLPPIYDRSALKLSDDEKSELKAKGIQPHYRFKLNDEAIEWDDRVRGKIHFEGKNISDPVLVRADGTMTYMIASVVDDIEFGITDIVRGEDHITNTAVHLQLIDALGGGNCPKFAHISLLKGKDEKISKRLGGFEIRALREEGIHPMAILSYLAKLGTSDAIDIRSTKDELLKEFDFHKYGKASCIYDPDEIKRLNIKFIHHSKLSDVVEFLDHKDITEEFWNVAKANVETFSDLDLWWKICKTDIEVPPMSTEDAKYCHAAAEMLPEGEWDESTWNVWISAVKESTGRKGKDLFMPIRLALTGISHGPELKYLLPLIDQVKAKKRLLMGRNAYKILSSTDQVEAKRHPLGQKAYK